MFIYYNLHTLSHRHAHFFSTIVYFVRIEFSFFLLGEFLIQQAFTKNKE